MMIKECRRWLNNDSTCMQMSFTIMDHTYQRICLGKIGNMCLPRLCQTMCHQNKLLEICELQRKT